MYNVLMTKKQVFVEYLTELFKDPKCELNFNNTFELLISVILSAQCTDKRVNIVTKKLFNICPTVEQMASIPLNELEEIIKPCGLYKNKAKNIKACCKSILQNFNGEVPKKREDLQSLAGVGRKTANVVLSVAFNENTIAVDTHVLRVSNRLGFCNTQNPNICEKALVKLFKTNLDVLHYRMVLFGRYVCTAKKPKCTECKLKSICKYYNSASK